MMIETIIGSAIGVFVGMIAQAYFLWAIKPKWEIVIYNWDSVNQTETYDVLHHGKHAGFIFYFKQCNNRSASAECNLQTKYGSRTKKQITNCWDNIGIDVSLIFTHSGAPRR